MMYASKLAVAVKSGGKVLREFGDTVSVPFGSEYSIFIKNLNNVRALVKITIDGENVTDDGLVVNANSQVDLERFLGDLAKGHRFKFIERTSKIEQHRGIGVEDGLIRIEFQYEKPAQVWTPPIQTWPNHYENYMNSSRTLRSMTKGASLGGVCGSLSSTPAMFSATATASYSATNEPVSLMNASLNDAGITVKGSVSDQKFVTTHMGAMESETHVMVIKLLGETGQGKQVKKPVTVKTKQVCDTCGHRNKATSKFCAECGTSLELI
jgi:hypothetical protein